MDDSGETVPNIQPPDDGGDIAAPLRADRDVVGVERDLDDVRAGVAAEDDDPTAGIVLPGDLDPAVDRHREAEPAGVVGVIADEVHAAPEPRATTRARCGHEWKFGHRSQVEHGIEVTWSHVAGRSWDTEGHE